MKIAVVGPGLMGRQHADRMAMIDGTALGGLVHPQGERWAREGFGDAPCEPTLDALARRTPIDGVIISSPNTHHAQHIRDCARLRIPMLVEKPFTDGLETAIDSLEAIKAANVPVLVGHHRLHNPIIAKAKEIISAGRLGKLVCVRGSAKYLKPAEYFAGYPWRKSHGGGPIKINFVHDIASLIEMLGPVSAVMAMTSSNARDFAVEDTASIIFHFENEMLGAFIVSDCSASTESWETTSGENSVFPQDEEEACYEVSGTRASLKIPSLKLIEAGQDRPSWLAPFKKQQVVVEPADPLDRQLRHFAEVVAGTASPRVTAAFGAQVVAVVAAIDRSIATGGLTKVPIVSVATV